MILRTITCDVCGAQYTERDFGAGFTGWCIIQGITKHVRTDEPMKQHDMQSTFCPEHKEMIAEFIQSIDEVN